MTTEPIENPYLPPEYTEALELYLVQFGPLPKEDEDA